MLYVRGFVIINGLASIVAHPVGLIVFDLDVLVLLAVAVPRELHLHAPVLVGVDLIACWTHHHGGLRPGHVRLGRGARRPELLLGRHRSETALICAWVRI